MTESEKIQDRLAEKIRLQARELIDKDIVIEKLNKIIDELREQKNELIDTYLKKDIKTAQTEYILCAANYYNDGIKYTHRPKNIDTGFITCGRWHHNCINTFAQIVGFPYNELSKNISLTEIQGFLTNLNRFIDRKQAYVIAFAANQIKGPNKGCPENEIGLTSEDLY